MSATERPGLLTLAAARDELHELGQRSGLAAEERAHLERRAKLLAWAGNGWHLVEFGIALGAGIAAGSVALVGFGLDSLIEVAAAGVVIWLFSVASLTLGYLIPPLSGAVNQMIRLITTGEGRQLFQSATGDVAPLWQRLVAISGTGILLAWLADRSRGHLGASANQLARHGALLRQPRPIRRASC